MILYTFVCCSLSYHNLNNLEKAKESYAKVHSNNVNSELHCKMKTGECLSLDVFLTHDGVSYFVVLLTIYFNFD